MHRTGRELFEEDGGSGVLGAVAGSKLPGLEFHGIRAALVYCSAWWTREREEEREQETGKRRAVAEKLVARSKIDAARLANVLLGRSSR